MAVACIWNPTFGSCIFYFSHICTMGCPVLVRRQHYIIIWYIYILCKHVPGLWDKFNTSLFPGISVMVNQYLIWRWLGISLVIAHLPNGILISSMLPCIQRKMTSKYQAKEECIMVHCDGIIVEHIHTNTNIYDWLLYFHSTKDTSRTVLIFTLEHLLVTLCDTNLKTSHQGNVFIWCSIYIIITYSLLNIFHPEH